MKRVGCLIIAWTMAIVCAFAQETSADRYYVIKDGALQNGVAVDTTKYCPLEMTQYDGYLSFKKKGLYYQHIYFKLPEDKPLRLENQNLVVEYMLPATALCDVSHWKNLSDNICAYKSAPTMTVRAMGADGKKNISRVYIDGKFDENSAKDFVSYHHFAYSKNKEEVVTHIVLSYIDRWQWYESEEEQLPDSLKIRNLYYETPKNSPRVFFSSQFDGLNTWNEEVASFTFTYHGAEVQTNNDDYYMPMLKMLYMNQRDNWTGSDGSGYLASELFHGLLVKNPALYKVRNLSTTDTVFVRPIQLPKGARTIDVEAIVRVDKRVKEGAKTEPLPIYIKYDNAKQLVKLFNDTIPDVYTKVMAKKIVPQGAKSFSLVLLQAPTATYVLDNLIISTKDPIVTPKPKSGPVAGKPVVPQQKK